MPSLLEERLERLRQARRDPQAMALIALDYLLDIQPAQKRAQLRAAIEAAAIPHWFDAKVLAHLLGISESSGLEICSELRAFPMIEPFPSRNGERYNVHEATRNGLRKNLLKTDSQRLQALSAKTLQVTARGNAAQDIADRLYHKLIARPDEAADECQELFRSFPNTARIETQESVRVALEELTNNDMLTGRPLVETLLLIGWVRYVRGEASQLRSLADRALNLARQIQHDSSIARALCLVADVDEAEGSTEHARQAIEQAVSIFARLSRADRGVSGAKRDLTIAYSRLGAILKLQGKLQEALFTLRRGLDLMNDNEPHTDDEDRFVALSVLYNQIGVILQEQGRLSESLSASTDSLNFVEKLTSRDSENTAWQLRLSTAQLQIASILQEQGKSAEAQRFYQKSFAIADRSARADPSRLASQQHVAIAYSRIGSLLQEQHVVDQALSNYYKARKVLERMSAISPSSTKWRHELALVVEAIGMALEQQEQWSGALSAFRATLNILKELAGIDPLNIAWRRDLGSVYGLLGTALQRRNQLRPARLHLRKGLTICEEVAQRDPANTASQRALAFAIVRLGNLYRATGDRAHAADLYARHLDIFQQLASIDPTGARSMRDLAIALRNMGELSLERGRRDTARGFVSQAVSVFERVVSEHEDQKRWQADLAQTRAFLAHLQN
jgi:tetratricopeptide (TPR) repeat protein